ncbi:MAG TPA: hypothetical protein VGF12_19505 [Roseateles sp.]|uniref:hypothetical protein n=1 Tax=Roseateles sp. TaxID=1971397 RepID=UPI002ED90268
MRPTRLLPILCCVAGLVAPGLALSSLESTELPGRQLPLKPVLRKQAPELQQRMQTLLAGLQATPQLADPRGVSVHPGLAITQHPELPMIRASGRVHLMPINAADRDTVIDPKTGRYQGVGEGNSVEILVNDSSHLKIDLTKRDAIFYEPERAGSIAGFPLYVIGGSMPFMLIEAPGRSLWKRVTVAEYLERLTTEGGFDAEPARRAAATLSPAVLAGPACAAVRRGEVVSDCIGPDPTYLVRLNPSYLQIDPRRPDAIQLMTVKVGSMRLYTTLEEHRKRSPRSPLSQALAAMEQYDWKQAARWVE